jgi:hypothetical protein
MSMLPPVDSEQYYLEPSPGDVASDDPRFIEADP